MSSFKEQIEYLGYGADKEGLCPQNSKLEAVQKMASPSSKLHIQVFFDTVGYYQRFIKNFAYIAELLFCLLKGDEKFIWTDNCERAFEKLKETLVTAPNSLIKYNKNFIVQTDASLTAIGGVLSQINDNGEEHPIAYCS